MSSLITRTRNKFLEAIRSVNPPGRWKILVVDEHSQRLLGSVLKQFDILEENVTLIERISDNRDPQPDFEAIYLLMPTSQNIDRIIEDFSGHRQYDGAHLFFIDGLSNTLFQFLTGSPAEPFLKGLQDLHLNFWALEAQVFSLKRPDLFFNMYSPPRSDAFAKAARERLEEHLHFMAQAISNVCITLNEFPYIRYYKPVNHPPLGALRPHAANRPPPPQEASSRWRTNLARGAEARAFESVEGDFLTKLLAFMVQRHLEEHKKGIPDFGKSEGGRPRATLIITDRTMDMVAPYIHEFTYQAMANDLLPIEDGSKYTYKFQSAVGAYEDKTATLTDSDNVWTDVRHMHMREAIDKLMADFNKFLEENAVFKGDGAANLNDMKEMLASLPQYQEQREKFSLHLSMAQECMGIFERDKLPLVANVEQNCATGLNVDGKVPKNLVEEMVPLLDSREIVNANKLRVVALYILHRDGVPDEDRRRLYSHARLTLAEQDAVDALVLMGQRISRASGDRDRKKPLKAKQADDDYELSRYKPLLKTLLEDHVAGRLDDTIFPYVKESPPPASAVPANVRPTATGSNSLRSQKPSWHRAARPGGNPDVIRQRVLVFIAGGATYSEVRETYQLSNSLQKDIYIGSTHMLTPRAFVDDMKVLALGGAGSRALPNGLGEPRGGTRDFQEYYDDQYYTKMAPKMAPPPSIQQKTAPRNPFRDRPAAPPPLASANSSGSTNSTATSVSQEKKKKRGLFSF